MKAIGNVNAEEYKTFKKYPLLKGSELSLLLDNGDSKVIDNMFAENFMELLRCEVLKFPLDVAVLDNGKCILKNIPPKYLSWCNIYATSATIYDHYFSQFAITTKGGSMLKVRNMTFKKLNLLLEKGLTYPIQIQAVGGDMCDIVDSRINKRHYSTFY